MREHLAAGLPLISVDTKKKEPVGDFSPKGRERQTRGKHLTVRWHAFVDNAPGQAAPQGLSEVAANEGWVSVGADHDTAAFALESIRRWWRQMGRPLYS